ncbi:MAG: helix-turn-helix domain-containing protein [Sumerlaeia bacterium]
MAEQRWLTVPEAAAHLGIATDTVYAWIHQRGLPAHRVGRLWRLDPDEIDAWVKSGKAGAPDAQAEGEDE